MDKVDIYALVGVALPPLPKYRNHTSSHKGTLPHVLECLCDAYKVDKVQLISGNKRGDLVYIRQLFVYWIRINYPGVFGRTIGQILGNRDHSTISHSFEAYKDRYSTNSLLPQKLKTEFRTTQADFNSTNQKIRLWLSSVFPEK